MNIIVHVFAFSAEEKRDFEEKEGENYGCRNSNFFEIKDHEEIKKAFNW